jgi:SSS family solute:Na+ symporter
MSTADSCMVAAAGNFTGDIVRDRINPKMSGKSLMRVAILATLVIGSTSLLLAWKMESVLDIILLSYGFMVAGLFVPTLGAMFWKRSSSAGALAGMLVGGSITVIINLLFWMDIASTPEGQEPANALALVNSWGLSPTVFGVAICAVFFVAFSLLVPDKGGPTLQERVEEHG